MNALKRWTLGGCLLVVALATGCVAQVGQGNEDPTGGSPQQLAVQQPAMATTPGQGSTNAHKLHVVRTADGQLVVVPTQEGTQQLGVDPTLDPGAPLEDDGDGREPDPHPWHNNNVAIAH